ncbi:TPA: relaxase domain-containing protein [Escherichia coli]
MVNGVNKHRSGYDLTFSAPKSVSVMELVGEDRRFIEAHTCPLDRQICTSHRKRRAPTGANLVTTFKHNPRKNPGFAQN